MRARLLILLLLLVAGCSSRRRRSPSRRSRRRRHGASPRRRAAGDPPVRGLAAPVRRATAGWIPRLARIRGAGGGRRGGRFAGMVGRPVVSIDHAGGLRTTYEPVDPRRPGCWWAGARRSGRLMPGHGRCPVQACLHWGLRRGETYLDPMSLLSPPRVRLLPEVTVPGDRSQRVVDRRLRCVGQGQPHIWCRQPALRVQDALDDRVRFGEQRQGDRQEGRRASTGIPTRPASPSSIMRTKSDVRTCAAAAIEPAPPIRTMGNRYASSPPRTAKEGGASVRTRRVSASMPPTACFTAGDARVHRELQQRGGTQSLPGAVRDVVDDQRYR